MRPLTVHGRVSITPIDADGQPTGPRRQVPGVASVTIHPEHPEPGEILAAVRQAVEDARTNHYRQLRGEAPLMRGVYHHRLSGIRSDNIDLYLTMVDSWKSTWTSPRIDPLKGMTTL